MIDHFGGPHRFLSNFYGCVIAYEGLVYPSSEHAYQAAKTLDADARRRIAVLGSPNEAKRAGRAVALRPGWERARLDVMAEILRIKFSDPGLRARLVATAPQVLVEGNYWGDTFWGVCRGVGENHLGKLLMALRDEVAGD